jgi:uncharacterized linocin/CFP29 family protein
LPKSIAGRLLENGLNFNKALRTNDSLRKEEWKQFDAALVRVGSDRLRLVERMMSRGLTYSLPNPLGTMTLEYERISDIQDAEIAMTPAIAGTRDRVDFELTGLPIFIIWKEFQLDIRVLNASRTQGRPLDTTMLEACTRKVNEKLEEIAWTNSGFIFDGYTYYGVLDEPNIGTTSLTGNWDESDASATAPDDVLAMVQAAINDKYFGPYDLFIPKNYATAVSEDYSTATNTVTTVRERIMQIDEVSSVTVADKLTSDNVALIQMTSDVLDLVEGFPPRVFEWQERGGFVTNFAVVAIMVPRIKSNYDDQSGIVIAS